MESETIIVLRQRAAELQEEMGALREQLKLLQAELMLCDIGINAMLGTTKSLPARGQDASRNAVAHHARIANPSIQKLTIKQLVVKALVEHFSNGATAVQLLDFFGHRWGRNEILRTSLSPQLSRLKEEGKIQLQGKVWVLASSAVSDPQPDLIPPIEAKKTAVNPFS